MIVWRFIIQFLCVKHRVAFLFRGYSLASEHPRHSGIVVPHNTGKAVIQELLEVVPVWPLYVRSEVLQFSFSLWEARRCW